MARLLLESWSSIGIINRATDLHPAYQALTPAQNGALGRAKEDTQGQQPATAGEGGNSQKTYERRDTSHEGAREVENNSNGHQQSFGAIDRHASIRYSFNTRSDKLN
ncbi:unnamed protein product [Dibothriocephalus latus]|uniref:Uncharacterized protein n=1 Tax=Dibothriocephalus latus TaxID=60516 RepID=A0A3P7LY31_DIBLA|nr:unnamed protein product [Dibothriocephalus latus]